MGPGAERDQTRESGAGYARQYPSEREKRIGQERYKTDESQGSGCVTWTIGCRLEEGEDKERSVTEGLMYVKRHAVTYEEQVLAEPCEVQREEEAVKQVA
jgi:hydroxymethylpyrimidine/phosphomethylpyrimidine kinase